jgi:hypothetical protein
MTMNGRRVRSATKRAGELWNLAAASGKSSTGQGQLAGKLQHTGNAVPR